MQFVKFGRMWLRVRPAPAAWSPLSLFGPGDLGAVYDHTIDSDSMWQTVTGAAAAAADGATVGFRRSLKTYADRDFPLYFLPPLPVTLVSCDGPGTAVTDNRAIDAAIAYNSGISNAGVYYVKPSTGSDSGAGTEGDPFATVSKALRTATGNASRVAFLEDCTIEPFELRNTDASQTTQQFKYLDANGYNVTVRTSGPDLTAQTWVQDETYTNCYKVASLLASSAQVTRVLRTDEDDDYGYDRQFVQYASAALLDAGTGDDGYYWDNAAKTLWLRMGSGENVEAAKAVLRGFYLNTAGTSRIFVYGSAIGFKGVRFEGVQIVSFDNGGRLPQIWLQDCVQMWSFDKGASAYGIYVADNHYCYASAVDGVNNFAKSATGTTGLTLTWNSQYLRSGDRSVLPLAGNSQGISAHGGSDHVSWGTSLIESNGQGVGDTTVNSEHNVTWLVGCHVTGGFLDVSSPNYLFGSNSTGSRKAFMDACTSDGAPGPALIGGDVYLDNNADGQALNFTPASIRGTMHPYGYHSRQLDADLRPAVVLDPAVPRRNLLIYTEQFDREWGIVGTSVEVTPAVAVEPNGSRADLIIPSAVAEYHRIRQLKTALGEDGYLSLRAKVPSGSSIDKIAFYVGGTSMAAIFDLTAVTASVQNVNIVASITDVGDGWYDLKASWPVGTQDVDRMEIWPSGGAFFNSETNTLFPIAGNGTDGILISRAQLETTEHSAYQKVSAYYGDPADFPGSLRYIDYDGEDDAMVTVFPDLGSSVTIGRAVPETGAVIVEDQTVSGSWTDDTSAAAVVIINRGLTEDETADLTAWLDAKAGE